MELEKRRLSRVVLSVFLSLLVQSCQTPPKVEKPTETVPTHPVVDHLGGVRVDISNTKIKDGEAGLVILESDAGIRSAKLEAFGTQFTFFSDDDVSSRKQKVVFPVPYDTKPGEYFLTLSVRLPTSEHEKKIKIEVVSGNYRSETLTVPPKKVVPPKSEHKRIAREQKELGEVYSKFKEERLWTKFKAPSDNVLTSDYGSRRVYNGIHYNVHQGVDYRAPTGTPIYSAAEGEVVLSKDLYFSGNTVILSHGYGLFTVYMHMSKLVVKKGDRVTLRQELGKSGATGRASGPHLHWGAKIQKVNVNPLVLLDLLG